MDNDGYTLISWAATGTGTGTVSTVSVVTANGVSGTVANATTTPAITLTLGAITPSTTNGLTLAAAATGFTIAGGTTSKTLTVALDANVAGTNTGDQSLSGLIAKTTNITSLNETGIADGEIAVFNLTNKDIRTSDKTIVTSLGADDTTVPTSKAVKDVTDGKQPTGSYEVTTNKENTTLDTSVSKYPTNRLVKEYADQLIGSANALVYKGVIDCSGNPNYPAADCGFMYVVSVAGKIGGVSGISVEVGDMLLCNTDSTPSGNQATVGSYWNIIEHNIIGAVTGPASSTDGHVAQFDSTTGKVIKDGGLTLSGTNTGDEDATSIKTKLGISTLSGSNTGDQDLSGLIAKTTNITALNETGIADGEIAVFNVTNKDIRTSDKTIVTTLGSDDTTVPTSKAVKDVTDGAVLKATIDAKGDLLVGSGDNTIIRLPVGAVDGQVLKIKASETSGLEWGEATGGGGAVYSDCTVGSAGDYTTLGAAITAGKLRPLLVSSTTETGDITLPDLFVLNSTNQSNAINMATYRFITTASRVYEFNFCTIIQANTTSSILFTKTASTIIENDVIHDLNGTGYMFSGTYSGILHMTRCQVKGNTAGMFNFSATTGSIVIVSLRIVGEGTTASVFMKLPVAYNNYINGLILEGSFGTSDALQFAGVITNILSLVGSSGSHMFQFTAETMGTNIYIPNMKMRTDGGSFSVYLNGGSSYWYDSSGTANIYLSNFKVTVLINAVPALSTFMGIYSPSKITDTGTGTVVGCSFNDAGTGSESAGYTEKVIVGNKALYAGTLTINDSGTASGNVIVGNRFTNDLKLIDNDCGNTIMGNYPDPIEAMGQVMSAYNYKGSTLNLGEVVVKKADSWGLSTTTTQSDPSVVGIVIASASNNARTRYRHIGKYTDIKVSGRTDISAGDFLTTYMEAGIARKAFEDEVVFGIAYDAYATDNSSGVINGLIIKPFSLPSKANCRATVSADATVGNTVTETTLIGTVQGDKDIPYNYLVVGKTIVIKACGYYSTDSVAPTLQLLVKIGSVTVGDSGAVTMDASQTNKYWELEMTITCRTIGATGTVKGQGKGLFDGLTNKIMGIVNTGTSTIDTTANNTIGLSAVWGTADADNTITCSNFSIQYLR